MLPHAITSADLVEQLSRLDLGKEAEVDDGQLPRNLLGVEIKDAEHGGGVGGELEREEEAKRLTCVDIFSGKR